MPFTLIGSLLLALRHEAEVSGSGVPVASALLILVFLTPPADPIDWGGLVPWAVVIGLSLAVSAVAPWKGGLADPGRVAGRFDQES